MSLSFKRKLQLVWLIVPSVIYLNGIFLFNSPYVMTIDIILTMALFSYVAFFGLIELLVECYLRFQNRPIRELVYFFVIWGFCSFSLLNGSIYQLLRDF